MELKIYSGAGSLKLTASPNSSSTVSEEVMGEYCVSAAFTHTAFVLLDVNDYAVVDGVKYKVRSTYRPKQKNTQTYEYNVKLYAPIHDAEDALFLFQADGEITTEFSYDGDPRAHLQLWVDNMNRIAGQELWSIGTVITGDYKTIEYKNIYCWDAAFGNNGIAAAFGTEMWADGYVINLCKAKRGDRVSLGYLQGLTSLAQEENGEVRFFTRLFPLGSTRNIDASRYGHARLQLPSGAVYVDKNTDLYGIKDGYEEEAFAGIYPKYAGTVTSVRTEKLTNEEGRAYTVYYFKDNGMDFNPADYEIPDYVKMVSFQTGELAGRGNEEGAFQANWHEDTQEWEIINVYPDDTTQLPGGEIVPKVGDTYIPWNFTLPQEYIDAAEQEYAEAVDDYLSTYSFDTKKYNGTTDRNYIETNSTPLKVGWNVRLLSTEYFTGGYKDTRITKVVRKLNDLCQATLTCTDRIGTGWKRTLENHLDSLQYELARKTEQAIIDIIKTTDTKTPSDYNVYSALRARLEFLSKTHPETMPFLMTFLDGIVIGEHGFAGGLAGFGARIDKKGYGEMRGLRLWEWLEVPELRFNRVEIFLGIKWRTPGGGIIQTCVPDTDAEGNPLSTGTCTLKLEGNELGAVAVDDIVLGIYHFGNMLDATEDSDDSKGNFTFAGFATTYFRITGVSGSNNGTFTYSLRPGYTVHPQTQMHFACYGNFTNESRQTSVYETRTYTRKLWKQNTWEIGAQNIAQQDGDLSNLNIHGMQMEGYSAYLNSVYFTGQILQTKPDGTPVRTANDRGAWETGHYDYYDRVSHNGCIWLCVNEDGTDSEPAEGNPDWLLQVRKGDDGEPGPQGVPGTDGKDGKTYYTWIRYADDAQGTGISNNPTGKEYIGFAYNKETATESNNPLDYTWSLIKGTDGQPGAKGEDGTQYWTWIAYSDNADGSNMYQVPNEDTKYIGIAVNKLTQTESDNPADYTWSKFKGEDGAGISNLGNWYTGLFVPYLGIVRMGYGSYMCINKNGTSNPPLWTITDKDGNRLLQTQDGGNTYGYILTGEMNTAEYVLVAADGADGVNGVDGIQGPKGEDGRTTYFHVKYSANPDGNPMSETPSVYIGTYVDYTEEDSDDYTKYTWSRFQGLQGEQGIPGKDGASGITYYWHIKYSNDGGVTFTANNGETPGKFMGTLVDTNPTDSSTPSAYKWAEIKGDKGDKGDQGDKGDKGEDGTSVSHHGDWKTGKFIPYMGIVRMGGSSWICINANGTSNPPCWTITDSAGNRLLQTQDGGRTYGYILTGENNTAEYDLVAEDGKPGADGKPGDKGEQGLQGCILRRSEWKTGTEYRNDEALTSGTRYLDVALVQDNNAATGWRAYKCRQTHTSSSANAPGTSGGNTYWEEFGINTTAIFTSLIIAKDALINFMSGNQLLIRKDDGTVTIGLTGGYNNKAYIWAGGTTPDNARFRVDELGKAVMTDSEVHGTIYAISGQIGGFTIVGNSLQNTGDGYITITNGKRMAGIGGGLAGILGYDAAGVFRNEETYSLPAGTVNIATYLSASGAQYNFAFQGRGNGVLSGIMEGYALNYVDNTSANVTDLTRGKYIEMNTPSGNVAHVLPRKTHVEDVLGVSSTTAFAVLLHYFGKYESGGSFTLYGRTTSVSGANTAEFPYLYDHNGNNVSVQIAKGDSAEVLLVYDGAQYFAQLLNVRN